jgi:putative membrane protein
MTKKNNIYGWSKNSIATLVAIIFHVVGLVGILYYDASSFASMSALNLLLMFGLLLYTQKGINTGFIGFFLLAFSLSLFAEIIGVNTGILFGDYQYGDVLGTKLISVPLIIGVNWFVITYCIGCSMHQMLERLVRSTSTANDKKNKLIVSLSVIIDGALLAVLFDWIMEPVAIRLGFWNWGGDGHVPFYNYFCWFMLSLLILLFFRWIRFDKTNKFALHLLLIQTMFFLILRTML